MSLFTRNLNKYGKPVDIQTRAEKILNGSTAEVFTTKHAAVKAIIKTLTGVAVFDNTNTERVATHRLCLAFLSGVTAEDWVLFGTKRIKVLTVTNVCEDDTQLVLMCTERGEDSQVVNRA